MADKKISDLTALAEAPATGDLLVLVDVSDTTDAASGTTKKITWDNAVPDASTTVEGKVELATDAEFTTATDETRYVNAKQVASVSQTLTNKTISLGSNTVSGTLAQLNTAVTDANLASLAGIETLTNKTLTSPKINEDVAVSATATELNILDGATLTTTELNYVDGVTSAIQTQLDAKAPLASPSLTGTATITNTTDAASVEVLRLQGDSATPAANDEIYQSFYLSDSAGNQTEFAKITARAIRVTDGTETGTVSFHALSDNAITAGVMHEMLRIRQGVAGDETRLYAPDSTSGVTIELANTAVFSVDDDFQNQLFLVGDSGVDVSVPLRPETNNGAALGTTARQFSDLFLAEGGVINWDNGDATITQTGNDITVAGVSTFGLGTSTALTTGTIELGAASDTTLSRSAAGVLAVEGVVVPTISSSNTLTNKTLSAATVSGITQLSEGASIALDAAGSADGAYSGITIAGTAGTTLAFGDLIYLAAADSRWELADADAATTADRMLGMCVLAAASDGDPTRILLMGNIRADAAFPALTIGSPVYVGETAGDVQTAIPTGADNVIRRVGYALTADELYFNPSQDVQTVVA